MKNVKNMHIDRSNFRRQLLTSASALALLASAYGAGEAHAADADKPQIWIELGGQFEMIQTRQDVYAPPFTAMQQEVNAILPGSTQIAPGSFQKPLDRSVGWENEILFEPEGTDWVFSAGIRYGRSSSRKHLHQGTAPQPFLFQYGSYKKYIPLPASYGKFSDVVARKTENHLILDFQAGKDVGLGMFGGDSSSTITAGLRFAQFNTGLHAILSSDPDPFQYKYLGAIKLPVLSPHIFHAKVQTTRRFQGFGPTISWNASAPVAGSADSAEFTFDWGINAALLFGRQRASVHHQTTAYTHPRSHGSQPPTAVYRHTTDRIRSRSIAVPNLGGFAGVSLKFPNAKVSLGYRADWFFGAMDGGIDTRKSESIGFHGLFASISIGLGD